MSTPCDVRNEAARATAVRTLDELNAAGAEDAIVKQYNALLDNLNAAVLDRFAGHAYSAVFEKYFQA